MKIMNLETLTREVVDISHEVGKFILPQKDKISAQSIEKKGKNDFVTYDLRLTT